MCPAAAAGRTASSPRRWGVLSTYRHLSPRIARKSDSPVCSEGSFVSAMIGAGPVAVPEARPSNILDVLRTGFDFHPLQRMVLRPLRLDLQHSICVRCQDIEGSDGHSSCGNQGVPRRASASSSKTLTCSGPTWDRSRTTASARDRRLQRTRHLLAQCHATGQTRLGHGSRCLPCINSWSDIIGRLPYLSRDPPKYTVALGLALFRQAFLGRARWDMATGSIEGRWLTRRLTG